MKRTNGFRLPRRRSWPARFGVLAGAVLVSAVYTVSARADVADIEDHEITNAIEYELVLDDAIDSNNIDVSTTEGIVQFTGEVDNILARDRAEAVASTVVGVRGVVNELKIMPDQSRTDAEVRAAVAKALQDDPATDSYEVTASVTNGSVALTGTVDSWQERELCEVVAKGVSGVREIENSIAVDYKSDRPDYEVQKEIEARLANDLLVDDLLLTVEVDDGNVTLAGSVGSLAEEYRARSDAWVAGVKKVDSNKVDIEWGLRDDMRRVDTYASQTDAEIKQAVNDAFLYDPRVISSNPNVFVKEGAVTLSGRVDNLEAKRAAEDDARNIIGVRRVINNLKVRRDAVDATTDLAANVTSALASDPYVESYDVTVGTFGGWVTLSGDVNTSFEKLEAERVAMGVPGVTRVFNNLDYDYKWRWKPDWEIKDNIKTQYFWSPYVDGENIKISVDDGIATLTGQVDTWSERQDAEANAYQGGAKDVDNDIAVKHEYYGPNGHYYGYFGTYPYPF